MCRRSGELGNGLGCRFLFMLRRPLGDRRGRPLGASDKGGASPWLGLAVVGLAFAFIAWREHREARYLVPRLSRARSRKRSARLRAQGYSVRELPSGDVLRSKVPTR